MSLYNSIYSDEKLFQRYLETISFTQNSKKIILEAVINEINHPVNKILCFLPCDVGIYYKLLKELEPNNKFILIDKSEKPLKYISDNDNHPNTEYIKYDISEPFLFKIKFDIAFTFLAIHHLNNINTFFNNVFKCLNNNGTFVIVTFCDSDLKSNIMYEYFEDRDHNFYSTDEIFLKLYQNRFEGIYFRQVSIDIEFMETEIPLIFNRFSNSFLYKQSLNKIDGFHRFLKNKSKNGIIKIVNKYTIIISNKICHE